ncbi:MAG: response regulator [Acetobacteraceae bacterium]|nr:response regulator [Acetobacteraceae bacterium]
MATALRISAANNEEFIQGGGELGALMRAKDWSATPLGPVGMWSRAVKTAVSLCLNSRFPIVLWLGPELRLLYNDAYIPFLGEAKHPTMLGAPGHEAWGEIWPTIGPMHDEARAGRATWVEDQLMFFARRLPREEVYVTFSYSPILGDDGRTVEGVFCACTETTERVLGERRLSVLRGLRLRTSEQRTVEAACRDAATVLENDPAAIPFAAIYLLEEDGMARRVAGTRLLNDRAAPERHPLEGSAGQAPWPLGEASQTRHVVEVSDVPDRIGILPAGLWRDPVERALVLPLAAASQDAPAGFLVVGVNPRRVLDAGYRGFLDLVAEHVATRMADARAFENERRRADALAELDRAKTAFFSNVSHEFRTPLTLMLGPLEELLSRFGGALPPGCRSLATVAHRNSLRLLRLVNTVLDFSRIEAGRVQALYEPIDLSAFTAELASSFRSACERSGLRLDVACGSLPEPVYVDRDMWEKIVLNLLSNAFKFTFEGGIAVRVAATPAGAELRVSDTGIGVPDAELPHLFERFHHIDGQRGRSFEGSGIGLALVHELVRLHGGAIRVSSEAGRGTTFTVVLPFGRAHLPADRVGSPRVRSPVSVRAAAFAEEALRWLSGDEGATSPRKEGASEPASAAPGERARVLVADDNADMRNYVTRLLSSRWDVEAVADGEAALAAARRRYPALVLSDVIMPGVGGLGLVAALRKDSALADVPVLLLSARAGEEARVEGLDAGADDYLTKPFAARELLARVASHIALARLRRDAAERLRASEERFRRFAEHSAAVLWIVDAGTELIEYLSPAYGQVWGEPPDAQLQRRWTDWLETVHPDDRQRIAGAVRRVLGGEAGLHEYRIVRADGAVRCIRDTFFPIRDGAGRVIQGAGIAQDVTVQESSLVYLVDGTGVACRDLGLPVRGAGYYLKAFASPEAFLEIAPALAPGCVLLDARASRAGGLAVLRELKAGGIALPVIMIGESDRGVGLAVAAMKAGAADYLEAPCEPQALLAAVASAMADIRTAAGSDAAAGLARARVAGMSPREREVLEALLAGGTNKTIARDLGISPRTVEFHRAHIMERLGARTLPEAVLIAAAAGLRPPRVPDLPDGSAIPAGGAVAGLG